MTVQLPPGVTSTPVRPEHGATHKIDVRPGQQTTGRWIRFLRELWPDDPDAPEVLRDAIGTALLGHPTEYAQCILLLGGGRNGKSVLLDAIERIFFHGVTSHICPSTWGREYSLAALRHARLNVSSELPGKRLANSATFKAVISGDPVVARQPYGKPEMFRPRALHIFAANDLPDTYDVSQGFWRRFVVLEMTQVFNDDVSRRALVDELVEDVVGAVEWALVGGVRAAERRGYHTYRKAENVKREWAEEADSVAAFLTHACDTMDGDPPRVSCREAYESYVAWCQMSGRDPHAYTWVGRRLAKLGVPSWRTEKMRGYFLRILPVHNQSPG